MQAIRSRAVAGLWSAVIAATAAGRPVYTGPGGAIPDNNPAGANFVINVPDSFTVSGVSIQFTGLEHTWAGDVRITLTHDATTFVLLDRPGVPPTAFGNPDDFLAGNSYAWSDVAAAPFPENTAGGAIPSGVYFPGQTNGGVGAPFISAFGGVNSGGVWTLNISDLGGGDVGAFVEWALTLEGMAGPVVTDVTWATPVSGLWSNAGNWNPPVVPNNIPPGQEFRAFITPVGPPYTVTMDQHFTISGFSLTSDNAMVDIGSQSLTVEGDYLQSGVATLLGMPGGAGTVTVSGRAAFTGGMLAHVFDFNSNGSLVFTGALTDGQPEASMVEICDSNVEHNGSSGAKWNNIGADGPVTAPTILLNEGATLLNGPLSTFVIESNATMEQTSQPLFTSVFTNQGTLRKQNSFGVTTLQNFQFINTGTVEVMSGTLRINGVPLPAGALQSGSWVVRPGTTLDFMGTNVLTNQATITLHGVGSNFFGLGGLRQNSGLLVTRTGRQFVVSPSTLLLTNSGGGQIRPGPNSRIGVNGSMTLASPGSVNIGISGTAPTTSHGRISATNQMTLGGTLTVSLESGFMPDWGDAYTIATYAGRAADFALFNFPPLSDPNLRWWRENNATTYRVGVRHVADTDHDNDVDFADLNNVLSTFGQNGGPPFLIGDCNEDGMVNFLDLNLVLSVFGQMAPPN